MASSGHRSMYLGVMWDLLQFSSSLPSGQSLKPLQRKRPMMQWTPLAQAKNVGEHFDLTLAKDIRVGGSGEKQNNELVCAWCRDGAEIFQTSCFMTAFALAVMNKVKERPSLGDSAKISAYALSLLRSVEQKHFLNHSPLLSEAWNVFELSTLKQFNVT